MGRTHFSWTTHGKEAYTVVEGSGTKLVATEHGVSFYPKGHMGTAEIHLNWAEAWALYKALEALDGPQAESTPSSRL